MYLSQPSTIMTEKSKVEATSQRRTKNWYFSASRRETPLNLILCFLALFSPPPYDPPRLLPTWLIAASVYPPIATLLPSLVFHNRRRIFSIRSWQTHTTIGSLRFPRRESAVTKAPIYTGHKSDETPFTESGESQSCRVGMARGHRPCANYLRFPATGANWIPRWIELYMGHPSGILALFNGAFNGHSTGQTRLTMPDAVELGRNREKWRDIRIRRNREKGGEKDNLLTPTGLQISTKLPVKLTKRFAGKNF